MKEEEKGGAGELRMGREGIGGLRIGEWRSSKETAEFYL